MAQLFQQFKLCFVCFLFCFSLWLIPLAQAQSTQPISHVTLRVGAVLSLTGVDADVGRAQEAALRAWQKGAQTRGLSVEIFTADDRSNPERAAVQAAQLLEDGVHALLCCAQEVAQGRVSPLIQDAEVLTLSLSPLTADSAQNYWLFSVAPGVTAQLETIVLRAGSRSNTLALMGLEGEIGDAAADLIRRSGMRLVAEERYPPEVEVLTPEALWVATRQPGAVLVWGGLADTQVAAVALSQRGFTGRIYISPEVYAQASALERADLRGAATVTNAVSVSGTLPRTHPTYGETRRFISALSATYGTSRPSVEGAYAWDALSLLRRAFEEVLAYNRLEPENTAATRQALRDSLVGLGPLTGAAAVYDFLEADHGGVQPDSLVTATIARGRLIAVR